MIYPFLLSVFAIFYCIICFRVIAIRRKEKIVVGSEKSETLSRNILAARNLFEYSVIFIMLVFVIEYLGIVNWLILLSFSSLFFVGRILHFLSMTKYEIRDQTLQI